MTDRVAARRLAVAAILLVAAALRVYGLGSVPLWTDELFTAAFPHIGLAALWTTGLVAEPTSPLYYSVIWVVERLAGESAFALRLPSVVGSLLGIWLAGRLARELSDRPAAAPRGAPLLAMLLLAVAPINVFYAQEARAYALQGAALALALLGFARVLSGRPGGLLRYASGAILAAWLHPTSLFALAAFNLAALAAALGSLLDRRGFGRWLLANAVVAAFCLPLLPVMLSRDAAAATSWIPALSRWSFAGVLGSTLAGPAFEAQSMQIAEIAVPILAAALLLPPWSPPWPPPWSPPWPRGRRAAAVLLLVPLLFLALMTAVSAFKPVLLSRTLAWLLIPLAVALADAALRPRKPVAIGLAAALVAAPLGATAVQLAQAGALKENWPRFLARLPGLGPPALIVLAPHTSPAALARYAPGAGPVVRLDDGGRPAPETTVIPRLFATPTISLEQMQDAVAKGRPVWLIYRRPEYRWMTKVTAGLPPPRRAVQDIAGSNPGMRALLW